jgi:hypothetical protein
MISSCLLVKKFTHDMTSHDMASQIKREMVVEDLERIQVNMGIAEGKSPQQLVQDGLTSAIDPKVLI